MNILMLGSPNIGKTTYLGAMYNELGRKGLNGFKIKTSLNNDLIINNIWRDFLTSGKSPAISTQLDKYEFDLKYNDDQIIDMNLLCLPGQIWVDEIYSEKPNYFDSIENIDGIIYFIDSDSMTLFDADSEVLDKQKKYLYRFILERTQKLVKPFPFVIVFNKFDLVNDEQKDLFKDRVTEFTAPFRELIRNNNLIRGTSITVSSLWKNQNSPKTGLIQNEIVNKQSKLPIVHNVCLPIFYLAFIGVEFAIENADKLVWQQILALINYLDQFSIKNELKRVVMRKEGDISKIKAMLKDVYEQKDVIHKKKDLSYLLLQEIKYLSDLSINANIF